MSDSTQNLSPDNPPDQRRIGSLILMGLGAIVLLALVGWLSMDLLASSWGTVTVPNSLAGLPLSRRTTGEAALAEIEQMHGKEFVIIGGVVAHYGGDAATLWVSSTWLPFMAALQVSLMEERIAEGRSPFTPLGVDQVQGVTVYALSGMGQMHYYFQLDRRVIWLAVAAERADQSLKELINTLR